MTTQQQIEAQLQAKSRGAAAMDRISAADLRAKLGVDEKWIKARLKEDSGFPEPMKENGRFYWSRKEIDRWTLAQVLKLYPLEAMAL